MKTSESIVNLAKALLTAQKAMGGATKSAANPYFKSKYADYGAVLEACKDHLNDNGILITQPHIQIDGQSFVLTTLIHAETGEFMTSETRVVAAKENDPQAFGSALTYSRRYGLQSFLAMPTEDDDAETAMQRKSKTDTPAPSNTSAFQKKEKETPKAAAPATDATPGKFGPVKKTETPAKPASNASESW